MTSNYQDLYDGDDFECAFSPSNTFVPETEILFVPEDIVLSTTPSKSSFQPPHTSSPPLSPRNQSIGESLERTLISAGNEAVSFINEHIEPDAQNDTMLNTLDKAGVSFFAHSPHHFKTPNSNSNSNPDPYPNPNHYPRCDDSVLVDISSDNENDSEKNPFEDAQSDDDEVQISTTHSPEELKNRESHTDWRKVEEEEEEEKEEENDFEQQPERKFERSPNGAGDWKPVKAEPNPAPTPAPAPTKYKSSHDEWKEAVTPEGKTYFYNRRTRETSWKLPSGYSVVSETISPTNNQKMRVFGASTCSKKEKKKKKPTAPNSAQQVKNEDFQFTTPRKSRAKRQPSATMMTPVGVSPQRRQANKQALLRLVESQVEPQQVSERSERALRKMRIYN